MGGPTAAQIRDFNARYHDDAARHYDAKWGIDFGAVGQAQVLGKLRKVLGGPVGTYGRSLEVGSGTGYFSLNLLQAGVVSEAVCSDLSPGMLATLRDNADRLGLEVSTLVTDAEQLPLEEASFDLVLGHAVLHHIPALERALAEFWRVLAPGGTLVFAGEPSRYGDRLARLPKRAALSGAPLWRRLMGASAARDPGGHGAADPGLEDVIDVHAFTPGGLAAAIRAAGFEDVRIRGEELLASWFGWVNRALEATAEPAEIPWLWRQYAYHGYLMLQRLDRWLLEPRLPPAIFYNLIVSARKPHTSGVAGEERRSYTGRHGAGDGAGVSAVPARARRPPR